jgi:uroporphyrinogen decarboxylase
MTPRELVLETLAKRESETLPYQIDLTDAVRRRLVEYFGDERFEDKLGNSLAQERNESFTTLSDVDIRDMFGVVWSQEQKGDFGVVKDFILKEPSLGDYRFPEPDALSIKEKCVRLCESSRLQFSMYTIGFSLFERAWSLRGMENIMMDFVLEPVFVEELLDRIVDYNLKVVDLVSAYPVDCIFFGDDWGQQRGLIMGPDHWRRFIRPRIKRMYAHVKARGMYVAQHACGDIHEVFGDLVDAGMDIYNTFQPEVYDIQKMKRDFGGKVTFYGGVSTQRLLPRATPAEVTQEVARLIRVIGAGGGYIIAPTHSIPDDVPTANILALIESVRNQRRMSVTVDGSSTC